MKRIRLNLRRENNLLCVDVEGGERQDSPLPFFDENFSKLYAIIKILDNDSLDVLNDEERHLMIEEEIFTEDEASRLSMVEHQKIVKVIGKKIFNVLFFGTTKNKLNQELHHESLHIQICYEYSALDDSYIFLCPWHLAILHQDIKNKAYFSYLIKHSKPSQDLEIKNNVKLVLIASDASDNPENGDISPNSFRDAIHETITTSPLTRNIEFSDVYQIGADKPSLQKLKTFINTKCDNLNKDHALVLNFYGHGVFKKVCKRRSCGTKCDVILNECYRCGYDLSEPQGYLLFQKQQGNSVEYVSSEELAEIISQCEPKPILAVIMACYSARSYKSETVYAGIAQGLISIGISAVIAFPFQISDESASNFIKHFYQSLFRLNSSIFKAFKIGCNACSNEWYRPVLFVRDEVKEDGKLFDLSINEPHPPIVKPNSSAPDLDIDIKNLDNIITSNKYREIIDAYAKSLVFYNELNRTILLFRELGSGKRNQKRYVIQILSCMSSFSEVPSMNPIPKWFKELSFSENAIDDSINIYATAYEEIQGFLNQESEKTEQDYDPRDLGFIKIVSEITRKTDQIVNFWDSLITDQLVSSLKIAEARLATMSSSIQKGA